MTAGRSGSPGRCDNLLIGRFAFDCGLSQLQPVVTAIRVGAQKHYQANDASPADSRPRTNASAARSFGFDTSRASKDATKRRSNGFARVIAQAPFWPRRAWAACCWPKRVCSTVTMQRFTGATAMRWPGLTRKFVFSRPVRWSQPVTGNASSWPAAAARGRTSLCIWWPGR